MSSGMRSTIGENSGRRFLGLVGALGGVSGAMPSCQYSLGYGGNDITKSNNSTTIYTVTGKLSHMTRNISHNGSGPCLPQLKTKQKK